MDVSAISEYGGGWDLVAYCGQCGFRAKLDRTVLIEAHGPEFPTSRLEENLECANCGARGVSVIVRSAREEDGLDRRS